MGMKKVASLETNYMKQQEITMRKAARRKKLLIRRLTAFLILTIALSSLVISSFVSKNSVLAEKQKEKAKLEETLASLEKRQASLENELVKLNDEEYIAKLARRDYFLSEKGEIIFNLPETKKKKEKEKESY
ncbi:FtsB family cell division protein [Lederbergia galactosidilytica]|uniref:Cell division protein DIVIC n=1 Tax=Lederbergia galactosidilytica TaxID=217031 RepID=A0A0Q9XXT0_9BACI|nr:septum formation initiator family protein [Lederbergia galactosidilytica]KRG12854.1 cell division protein DIVIC [Virgibacillus soli]KRG13584.1 cell division protein DIVIC [Lederbergia galactosidilytica]MBP1916845.1 cell division protein DivIC [Lederbergia galactosidilytica]OAK72066.1 cell division protein DIVIC [Lederbergia galactosidilytica]